MTAAPLDDHGVVLHAGDLPASIARVGSYPRLRYMGSKYKLVPRLAEVFVEIGGRTALDAFSGSGVVSYLLKSLGYQVTANDFLNFPAAIARASTVNSSQRLTRADVERICGPAADDRDFIQSTFDGLYFSAEDRRFLDSAWSHVDTLPGHKQAIAISALVLAAARRQPRGVFTVTDASKYDDGRRDLKVSLADHFRAGVREYNAAVFSNGLRHRALVGDVFDVPDEPYDVVYFDPPYAPPRDDADYMKRYHFLEGLSVYWRGQTIMQDTLTKKIEKKYTPFAYKKSVVSALEMLFEQFTDSTIVMSYSSNAVPDEATIRTLLRQVRPTVTVIPIAHTYSFGTHATAARKMVDEYIFVAK